MARNLWSGSINFGLVNIPVSVASADASSDKKIDFDLVDRKSNAPVGYQKINKVSGKKVDSDDIVKGFKWKDGNYILFEDEELKKLRVKGSRSIDLQQFVNASEVDWMYFERPYFLLPGKGAEKTYVLLRETLKKADKLGVGLITFHSKQHVACIGVRGDALVLELVRFAHELKKPDEFDFPKASTQANKVSVKEVAIAEKLIDELTEAWDPRRYQDTYYDEVMEAIKRKAKSGTVELEHAEEDENEDAEKPRKGHVLDLMPLLEKSLKAAGGHGTNAKASAKKRKRG